MKQRLSRWLLAGFLFLLAFGVLMLAGLGLSQAFAQEKPIRPLPPKPLPTPIHEIIVMPGRIIAPPEVASPISLKKYDVNVSIKDNVATTTIEQVFVNNTNRTLEASYLYPLPEDAHFSSFTLTINGEAVEGKILDKDEARKKYYRIVRKLIDPGLLEYVDQKTVQASIAPIFAHEEKKVQLSYTQLLRQDGGMVKYQYPFGLQTGRAMPIKEVALQAKVKTSQPLKTVYSPSHSPDIDRKGDREALISLKLDKAPQEKSFVLYLSQDNREISINSLQYKKTADGDGYFLLTVRPPADLAKKEIVPKDLALVIDTSGSMGGQKIVQAKEALRYIINQLRPGDTFNVVQFNTDVSSFKSELVSATADNKKAALDYVDDLYASGSTNIEAALKQSLSQLPKATQNRPGYVIFLTDGEPTVGITDTEGLVKVAKEANDRNAKLFNFGVGYHLNTQLLGKLAESNHGSTTYVEPNENLELALTSFYQKIEAPVLTDVKLVFDGIQATRLYPQEMGDLFAGSEVVLLGRYTGGGSGKITLTGFVGGESKSFSYPIRWEEEVITAHSHLPRLWAGRRIAYLLENIRLHGENAELKEEVVDLSKQYGIITPYTSFLALEPEYLSSAPAAPPRFRPMATIGGANGSAMPAGAMAANRGQSAVQLEKKLQQLKAQASMDQVQEATAGSAVVGIQAVGDKTFVLSPEGVWTDTVYDAKQHGKPSTVTFGTDAYFDLLLRKPELAPYFSLGQSVLVVLEGHAYQVAPSLSS